MALPNGLAQISDIGSLMGGLSYDLVSVPSIAAPFTSITNRAQMLDLSKDLGVRAGNNRIILQQCYQIQNEFGPNGEPVYGAVNDPYNQVRFVGTGWLNSVNASGQNIGTSNVNDYVEVSYYGTGLVMLNYYDSNNSDWRASLDNAAEGSQLLPSGKPSSTANRNYSFLGQTIVATGQTLGFHTARIRLNSINLTISGFEVLNHNSGNILVNVGTMWKNGQKIYNSSQSSTAYNSVFESGTLAARGGRSAVYIKQNGSIGKSLTVTNSSAQYLTAADHTNEEIARIYHFREFGAGRSDDFSLFTSGTGASQRTFTIDDCNTTLVGNGQVVTSVNYGDTLGFGVDGTFFTLTFTGCGLDIIRETASAGTDVGSVVIDGGSSVGNLASSFSYTGLVCEKIVSGLPYGTHTVKLTRVSGGSAHIKLKQFVVYQPKTPSIPSGAVQIGAYNILADFAANTTAGRETIATGVLRKSPSREMLYVGSWGFGFDFTNSIQTTYTTAPNNGDYFQYMFYGTGFEYRFASNAAALSFQISVDGVTNLSGAGYSTSSYGSGIASFTASTGTASVTSSAVGNGIRVSNIPLGYHTLKITKTSAGGNLFLDALDIVTPIHAYKDNGPMVLQNTLSCGNQGIEDLRKLPTTVNTKRSYVAQGVTANPTGGTNGVNRPLEDMSLTAKITTNMVRVYITNTYQSGATNAQAEHRIFVNGNYITPSSYPQNQSGSGATATMSFDIFVGPGTHKFDVAVLGNGNTLNYNNASRVLSVKEID